MKATRNTPPSLQPFEPGEPSVSPPVRLTDELRAKLLRVAANPLADPKDVESLVDELSALIDAATPLDDRG